MQEIRFEYKITALYILIGGLWISSSDMLLGYFVRDPELLTTLQTYKGWFYVLITSILFYMILKRHLVRLREAEFRARESDNLKTAFLRNISHEIRTPMNSIIGFATLLNENDIPDIKKSEYLKTINNSSNQLLNLVNEILDISLIETGNLGVIEKQIFLNKVMEELHSFFKPLIKPGIEFYLEKGLADKDSFIISDEIKIRKVLTNIINNSLKFTEKGQISFGYKLKQNELEFFIEDSGIGIPEEFIPNIFNRFQKAENPIEKLYDGLGLGLSISKGNIDLLKGKIWVDSSPGKGSTFYFTIPYRLVKR
jgi:signal transduction histidine kinase